MNQLIRCKNCDQIFLKSPFDECPEYGLDIGRHAHHFRKTKRDDFKDFLFHHRGHQLENLNIVEDSYISEEAYSEPVKTSFFKASNGREKFVIKKSRKRIDEPLKYELVPGDYGLKCVSLKVQSDEIQKQLRRDLIPRPSQDKIDAFLKLMGALVKGVSVQDLERIPEESRHPMEVYYKIDDVRVAYLLKKCRNIFKAQEYSALKEFVQRQKDDGVLLLKAIYKIQISQKTGTRKRVTSLLPFEKEEVFGQK